MKQKYEHEKRQWAALAELYPRLPHEDVAHYSARLHGAMQYERQMKGRFL
jgi:hypothetical protein